MEGAKTRRAWPIWVAVLTLVLGSGSAFGAWVYFSDRSISAPVADALASETGADTQVHARSLVSKSEIVFDVRSVQGSISMADMTRRLLKAAQALKDQRFEKVYLAYQGSERFYLDGSYFQQLGNEYGSENPVYTIRTLPEHVKNLDGNAAFGEWEGGLIGVVGKQFEDLSDFHRRWWANDALTSL